jgi:peptidoglycan/LPS O-acetylase OafA/YrhL
MRFTVLDGWRGIAALLVALFHLQALGHFYDSSFVRHAFLFVDFFFVLSGFVLMHAYRDRLNDGRQFTDFVVRRFGRIYPLHIAIVVLLVLLEGGHLLAQSWSGGSALRRPFTDAASPWAIVSNTLLFQGLGVHDQLTLNYPSWSISAEFWTYLVFGLVCLATGLGSKMMAVTAALLAGVGATVVGRYSPDFIDTTYGYGFFRCLYGFFVGVLTCMAFKGLQPIRLRPTVATACELLCVAGTVVFVSTAGGGRWSLVSPLVFAAVVGVFALEGGLASRLLNCKPVAWLGMLSYSIYMCHFVILLFMRHLAIAYLAVVVGCSAVTYRYVENPGRRYFNRLAAEWAAGRAAEQPESVSIGNDEAVAGLATAATKK